MAALVSLLPRPPIFGLPNPYLSAELTQLDAEAYDPAVRVLPRLPSTTRQVRPPSPALSRAIVAPRVARSYHYDFYERIRVRPAALDLGNIASAQVRDVYVWNAFLNQAHTLEAVELVDGDGITLTAPGALPLAFTAMQERKWTVTIGTAGPPRIDAALTFSFTGLDEITVTITGNRLLAWPVPPDWKDDIRETLAWSTDVQMAFNGDKTAIPLRAAPRRQWEFPIIEGRRERRIIENMLYDWTARTWALPVWPDVTFLGAPLAAGAEAIAIATANLDFRVGGLALVWSDVQHYELVEIAAIASDALSLSNPLLADYPRGSRVYPCRNAQLLQAPELGRLTDQAIKASVRFETVEPCDWPAVPPAAVYLGHPVLEHRCEWTESPTAVFDRITVRLDGDVGLVDLDDPVGLAWQRQSHAWMLHGRAERGAHRSLLYWLQGRAARLWLPSGADDIELLEPVGDVVDTLVVAWCGVASFLRQQEGRRHLRIELHTGQVFYRRVTGAEELDADRERLQLSSALGVAIAPSQVRQISWMVLSHQEADAVEIGHVHDSEGLARVRVVFEAAGREEP